MSSTKGRKFSRKTVYVWNQNCVLAGRACWPDRNGDVPEGDVSAYKGTPASLERWAKRELRTAKGFAATVAQTVLDNA